MPKAHQKHREWTPGRFLNWAVEIGPRTRDVVKHLLENRPHPEHGYRACLGLLALAKRYGEARLEAACARALAAGSPTCKSVVSILERGLDQAAPPTAEADGTASAHDNVRGPGYYHQAQNEHGENTMLTQHTLQTLRRLKLNGMADAFEHQLTQPTHAELSFEERVGSLVDREMTSRDDRRLQRLLKAAKLKYNASVEDINYRHARGLQRAQMASLVTGEWVRQWKTRGRCG